MSQRFFVAEAQRGEKGQFVSAKQTIADVRDILAGKLDKINAEKFLFIGSLKDLNHGPPS